MNKKQEQRAAEFRDWLKKSGLTSHVAYFGALRNAVAYVERFAAKARIVPSARIPDSILPKESLFEFYKPVQIKPVYEAAKGKANAVGRNGVGDNGTFSAAIRQYVTWLRKTMPWHWKNEPAWEARKPTEAKRSKDAKMRRRSGGYVYILTNPSFKADWVKIGKTADAVDERARELDNTSIPLPFDIYATLWTSKYEKAEKMIHHLLDKLTTTRIRPNREFFNLNAASAFGVFKEVADLLEDAELELVVK